MVYFHLFERISPIDLTRFWLKMASNPTTKFITVLTAVHSSSTAVIAHGFWAQVGSILWATSTSIDLPVALRGGASRTARDLFTPLPHRHFRPFYHRLAQSDVFKFETRSASKKVSISGAQPPSDFRDTSHRLHGRRFSLAQEKQRCARREVIYCCYPNAVSYTHLTLPTIYSV